MRFKQIRKARGLSLQAVADILGVSVKTLLRIESGERVPKADILYKIASIYGCKVDDFYGEVDPTSAPARKRGAGQGSSGSGSPRGASRFPGRPEKDTGCGGGSDGRGPGNGRRTRTSKAGFWAGD